MGKFSRGVRNRAVLAEPEMLDEAAAGLALARCIVDRQIDEVGLCVR